MSRTTAPISPRCRCSATCLWSAGCSRTPPSRRGRPSCWCSSRRASSTNASPFDKHSAGFAALRPGPPGRFYSYNAFMKQRGNVYLVGMMGAGKSTVGRLLARRLKLRFIDCDIEIERRCGVKVPLIFEIEGEAGFRARESQVLEELTMLREVVLATGGGTVLDPANRHRLAAGGTVVYLCAEPEMLYERVRQDRNRPLLATGDPLARLRELYVKRDPLYREVAHLVVETGRQTVQTLARTILDQLAGRWKASA